MRHWTLAKQVVLGRAIVRLGDGLGREGATRTHLAVAQDMERIGLRLLLPSRDPALRKYVDAQQAFADQVQAKFAALTASDPDNLLLQARVARGDADPLWRREAVWALGQTLAAPRRDGAASPGDADGEGDAGGGVGSMTRSRPCGRRRPRRWGRSRSRARWCSGRGWPPQPEANGEQAAGARAWRQGKASLAHDGSVARFDMAPGAAQGLYGRG